MMMMMMMMMMMIIIWGGGRVMDLFWASAFLQLTY